MDQYRVLGNPIAHSKSPLIHTQFAQQTSQDINYDKLFVELDGFDECIQQLIKQGIRGANVTAPFKEDALRICNQLSDRAKTAGAVNTLKFDYQGGIYGDNTDGVGLVTDLLQHQVVLKNKSVCLLGAGGAVKGVLLPLLQQQPALITIANRTKIKAEQLADLFQGKVIGIGFEQLHTKKFDVVINATSSGLTGQLPAIPESIFSNNPVVYDMVYAKGDTPFNAWAKLHGVENVIDGLGMLVAQAAESFKLWRNVQPEIAPVMNSLRATLV